MDYMFLRSGKSPKEEEENIPVVCAYSTDTKEGSAYYVRNKGNIDA